MPPAVRILIGSHDHALVRVASKTTSVASLNSLQNSSREGENVLDISPSLLQIGVVSHGRNNEF